jgi:hypothetical protein
MFHALCLYSVLYRQAARLRNQQRTAVPPWLYSHNRLVIREGTNIGLSYLLAYM